MVIKMRDATNAMNILESRNFEWDPATFPDPKGMH